MLVALHWRTSVRTDLICLRWGIRFNWTTLYGRAMEIRSLWDLRGVSQVYFPRCWRIIWMFELIWQHQPPNWGQRRRFRAPTHCLRSQSISQSSRSGSLQAQRCKAWGTCPQRVISGLVGASGWCSVGSLRSIRASFFQIFPQARVHWSQLCSSSGQVLPLASLFVFVGRMSMVRLQSECNTRWGRLGGRPSLSCSCDSRMSRRALIFLCRLPLELHFCQVSLRSRQLQWRTTLRGHSNCWAVSPVCARS